MNRKLITAGALALLVLGGTGRAQQLTPNIPYVEKGHERHVLDIYTPEKPAGESLPGLRPITCR